MYCIDETVDEPIMLINRHIGFDAEDGQGIDGSLFQEELLRLDNMGKKRIQVWINSPGGLVMDGYNIYNAILKSKTPVDTYNVGIAASIAGVIFMAGRKRVMADYSKLMMHNPYGGDDKKSLNAMKDSLVKMIAAKCSLGEDVVGSMMDCTTWMGASECLEKGFCTDIEVTAQANKKYMSERALWKEANQILNKQFQKNTPMVKVTNKLKLNDAANEDQIVAAIESIENRAAGYEKNLKEVQDKLTEKESELTAVKNKLTEAEDKIKKAEEDAKAAEKAAAAVANKSMVEGFVKTGKIKAEEVNKWVEACDKLGADDVKNMLDKLPVNKAANKLEQHDESKIPDGVSVAAVAMKEVRDRLKI